MSPEFPYDSKGRPRVRHFAERLKNKQTVAATPIFLSHTGADKSAVSRFYAALRRYHDIDPWLDINRLLPGDDLLTTITQAVVDSDHMVLFWSKNAFKKYNSGRGVGDLSWVALEIRTALEALREKQRSFILVRLDSAPWPQELMAHFSYKLYVDATGLIDTSRADHDVIVWDAVTRIVASLRGRPPIYPSLEILKRDGKPVIKKRQCYFVHTWVGGHDKHRSGVAYIESLDVDHGDGHRGRKVPAVKYGDGSLGYRFSIPDHTKEGWWSAALSFGQDDTGWCTVDLSTYKEMRFNARAGNAGAPFAVSFTDNHQCLRTASGHNETSNCVFRLGNTWHAGEPWILDLDDLDWSRKGFPGNERPVNRAKVLQIVLNNGGQLWEPGSRWIEVKNIVFL